jgi:hypothetical protein
MKIAFVSAINQEPTPTGDATAWHAALPRAARKTLRLHTPRTTPNTFAGVDHYLLTEYRTDTVHTQNLEFLDRAYDFDEFGDIDDEYEGLTITEPMDDVQMFHFCTGYDIL